MKKILISVFTMAAALSVSTSILAKDDMWNEEKWKNMSKEDRAKRADMHTKMADCLRSDKSMSDCHREMMDSCKGMEDGCPMMDMKGKGKGKSKK